MDSGWRSLFDTTTTTTGGGGGRQSRDFQANAGDNIWDLGTTTSTCHYDYSNNHNSFAIPTTTVSAAADADVSSTGLMYGGVGSSRQHNPDPHMMCLRLGKRHYCEDSCIPLLGGNRTMAGVWQQPAPAPVVPRCQVEGCHVGLANAKEYHRRHKVCEVHSKAPKVVVLGVEQRFCQQCSRFHRVKEFDEAKRSCRKRLEGHNKRRRKGALSHSPSTGLSPQSHENNVIVMDQYSSLLPSPPPVSKTGCAFSLLSSPKSEPWGSSTEDLSSRCSAALRELIAENRAAAVFGHYWYKTSSPNQPYSEKLHLHPEPHIWDRFDGVDHTTMTLDLMQASSSTFGLLSIKGKSKDTEECDDYWTNLGGTNVV